MKKIFILILFFAVLSGYAQERGDFQRGNDFYAQGQYSKALLEYQKILSLKKVSGNLHYNIGNCYVKQGKLAKAVLYYERAKRIMPHDADLVANYNYVSSLLKHNVTERKPWFMRVIGDFPIDGVSVFLSFVFIALVCALAFCFINKVNRFRFIFTAVILVIILFGGSFLLKAKLEFLNSQAVVISSDVQAKFEPLDMATTHFTLYEGQKVLILDHKQGWYKLKRSDGKVAWVSDACLEKI
ncbi:MAG: tetratricopeptide repeat protein [Candidatus Omnitrophica bacterium]|nr:tetratricopeptide repeat protein [Candidatus Omnitrophota bacterium]